MSGVIKAKPVDPAEFEKPDPVADSKIDVVDSFFSHVKDQIRYDPNTTSSWTDAHHYCNQHDDPRLDWRWGSTSAQSQAANESKGFVRALVNSKGDLDFKEGVKVVRNGMTLLVRDVKFKQLGEKRLMDQIARTNVSKQRENMEQLAEELGVDRNFVAGEDAEKPVTSFQKDL